MQDLIRKLLAELGEDPGREGLLDTPKRVEKALKFLTSGYDADIDRVLNNALFTVDYNEMVIVKDIDFYSLCEHHLLPFFGKCHVAYIPSNKVIGLSKIPRIVDVFSRRLQVQERLTNQIADTIREKIAPLGVAVVMEATHLCMSMRGVEKQNSFAVTSAMLGAFRDNARTRMEFLELIKLRSAVPGLPRERGRRTRLRRRGLSPTHDHRAHLRRHLCRRRRSAACPCCAIDRTGAAIIGAVLMIVTGAIGFDDAVRAVDFRTLVLLFGMMIIVAHLRLAGGFAALAGFISRRVDAPGGRSRRAGRHVRRAVGAVRQRHDLPRLHADRARRGRRAAASAAAVSAGARDRVQHRQCRDDDRQSAEHADRQRVRACRSARSPRRLAPVAARRTGDRRGAASGSCFAASCAPRADAVAPLPAIPFDRPLLIKSLIVTAGVLAGFLAGYDTAIVAAAGAAVLLVTRRVRAARRSTPRSTGIC